MQANPGRVHLSRKAQRATGQWQGRWRCTHPVGSGLHGHGFAAIRTDDPTGQRHFLKVIRTDGAPTLALRFQAEVETLSLLSHPRVPTLVETNVADDPAEAGDGYYLVTTFYEGPTLAERILPKRTLPETDSIALALALLDALGHCHARGRVHGDLKPANVILRHGEARDPILIDFSASWPTEMAASAPVKRITFDARNDLTSVARILFGCLTGRYDVPFRDWQARAPHQRPVDSGGLGGAGGPRMPGLRALFDRAFALHLEDRFQSAGEMRDALARLPGS
jgi:serine/threonine protein kinase